MNEELYKEQILEHYRHPRNKGELSTYDNKVRGYNPSCGDDLFLYLRFDGDDRLSEVSFDGDGCAISQASFSLLTEQMKGKERSELSKITQEDLLELLGISISAGRIKCALLPLTALDEALTLHHSNPHEKGV